MTLTLRGAPVAGAILASARAESEALERAGVIPTLAALRVGEREDDLAYERAILRACEKSGVALRRAALPAGAGADGAAEEIDRLNRDAAVHGILLFRPLPEQDARLCALVSPEKDVDGVTADSMAALYAASAEAGGRTAFTAPCTAEACVALLRHYGVPLAGRRVTVVGRSLVVGRPLAMLLLRENATVTIAHSRTEDLAAACREAEVVIAAAGKPGLLGAAELRPGQTVVDVGIHVLPDGSLCGDVRADEAPVRALTPVPGGVGPVTSALLCRHTVLAARACAAGRLSRRADEAPV